MTQWKKKVGPLWEDPPVSSLICLVLMYYPLVFSGLSKLVTWTEAENTHSDGIWCVLFSLGNKLAYLRRELQMGQLLCNCIVIGYIFFYQLLFSDCNFRLNVATVQLYSIREEQTAVWIEHAQFGFYSLHFSCSKSRHFTIIKNIWEDLPPKCLSRAQPGL